MDIVIPIKPQELKHHMKNVSGIAGRIFGKDYIAHIILKQVTSHIDLKNSYNYEIC